MDIKRGISNLHTRPDGQPIALPIHLFFYITLAWGLAFILPPNVLGLNLSELFMFSQNANPAIPLILGVWMVALSVINAIALWTRNKVFGGIPAMMGVMAWIYIGFAYVATGFWFALLVAPVPNVIFWSWYYFRLKMWHRII